jgi:CDP-diacylglycerol--serine O-phosphatidyltransferase
MTETPPQPETGASLAAPRKGLKKGLYLIPSTFTTLNIGLGFYAIMAAFRAFQYLSQPGQEQIAAGYFDNAARAIGLAVVCDALDGRLARMTKTTTEIGVQLDSIADVVTFGVAPAVLAYAWGFGSAWGETHQLHKVGLFISFIYLMCGGFRLARFNVQASRPHILAVGAAKLDKKNFVGLPIPAAAGLIAAVIHFAPFPLLAYSPPEREVFSGLMMALVAILSFLMVSTFKYTSFKSVDSEKSNPRFLILGLAALGMLIWLYSRQVLLVLATGYVLHGLLFRLLSTVRTSATTVSEGQETSPGK